MAIIVNALTPFGAWEYLNLQMLKPRQRVIWAFSEKAGGVLQRYCLYDIVIKISCWDEVWQPFVKTANTRVVPFFPGYQNLFAKMQKLREVYVDEEKLDMLGDYIGKGRGLREGGAPGMHFKAATVAHHGSCLTSFSVVYFPGRLKKRPEVRIVIRASELTPTFFCDLLLFDELMGDLGLKPCRVVLYIVYGYWHMGIGGLLLLGLYGGHRMKREDPGMFDYLWSKAQEDPATIKYHRRARVTRIVQQWCAHFGTNMMNGILQPGRRSDGDEADFTK